MSVQNTAPGFEPTTFRTRNHQTRPLQLYVSETRLAFDVSDLNYFQHIFNPIFILTFANVTYLLAYLLGRQVQHTKKLSELKPFFNRNLKASAIVESRNFIIRNPGPSLQRLFLPKKYVTLVQSPIIGGKFLSNQPIRVLKSSIA